MHGVWRRGKASWASGWSRDGPSALRYLGPPLPPPSSPSMNLVYYCWPDTRAIAQSTTGYFETSIDTLLPFIAVTHSSLALRPPPTPAPFIALHRTTPRTRFPSPTRPLASNHTQMWKGGHRNAHSSSQRAWSDQNRLK